MNPKVEAYYQSQKKWKEEQEELRRIILSCGLEETYKWKHPCYTYKSNNIAIVGGFKEYCSLSFFKGSLLGDPEKILHKVGKNTQSSMLLRFTSVKEIITLEKVLKSYIFEAVEVEKAGLKVPYKRVEDYEVPEELQSKMQADIAFRDAFEALTPGRQKGYLLHISSAKQSKTRLSRIENARERIFKGKGIDDCICGHSKHMPRCDGSHRHLTVD